MRKYSSRELFAKDVQTLLTCCHARGYGVTFGETFRTNEQQIIYRFGFRFIENCWIRFSKYIRSKVKISQHQKRLAIDLHIWNGEDGRTYILDEEWIELGNIWCGLSSKNRWGGNFKPLDPISGIGWDRWHLERRG